MKKFFKNKIFQNGYMLLLAFLGLISVSLAWFITTKNGSVDTFSFASDDAPHVYISKDGVTFVDAITFDEITQTLNPITGNGLKGSDGKVNLWASSITAANDVSYSGENRASADAYYECDLYFTVSNITDIYLSPESEVTPMDTAKRISNFGNFSEDYIAGAVRVGIYKVTTEDDIETETLQAVWVPNPNYELATNADGSKTFTENGNAETAYSYFNGTDIVTGDSKITSVLPCKIDEITASEESQTLHYRIRIWVEGTDREADTALSGGLFSVKLNFESKSE